jgi:hypothetical protein
MLILGLFFLLWSQNIAQDPNTRAYPFSKLLFEHLATALLAGACVSGLYEYFLRKEFLDTTSTQTGVLRHAITEFAGDLRRHSTNQHKEISEALAEFSREEGQRADRLIEFFSANKEQIEIGISHCFLEVDRFDFTETFEESEKLTVILNDGRGLVSNYYQRFVNRFQRESSQTTVILMHPNSPAVDLHAAKVGTTPEGLRIKIAETIQLLKRANIRGRHLRILGHDMYNTMSVFLTEKEAIVTPYFLSKVRRTPPVLSFVGNGRESFYHKLKEDADALSLDCTDISSYTATDGRMMSTPSSHLVQNGIGSSVGQP